MPSKKKPQEPAKPEKPSPRKDLPSDSEHEPAPRKGGSDGAEE